MVNELKRSFSAASDRWHHGQGLKSQWECTRFYIFHYIYTVDGKLSNAKRKRVKCSSTIMFRDFYTMYNNQDLLLESCLNV